MFMIIAPQERAPRVPAERRAAERPDEPPRTTPAEAGRRIPSRTEDVLGAVDDEATEDGG